MFAQVFFLVFRNVMEVFQEECVFFVSDHAKVATSLFHYWITDILPVKNRK